MIDTPYIIPSIDQQALANLVFEGFLYWFLLPAALFYLAKLLYAHPARLILKKGFVSYFKQLWIYRRISGGLWVKFKRYGWEHTNWVVDCDHGYIINQYDKGTYHKSFNLIEKIEDYTKKKPATH